MPCSCVAQQVLGVNLRLCRARSLMVLFETGPKDEPPDSRVRLLRCGRTEGQLLGVAGVLTAAASRIGPVTSASHHVVISIYMFFCMCGDAVSQAAQSFLPGVVRPPVRTFPPAFTRRTRPAALS